MHKNRGMLLETIINQTISYYENNNIAFIEKKGLPIKFSKLNAQDNKLYAKDAFIYKKSTVDYTGCYKGRFLAFEAKSTNESFLPKNNIREHQKNYLLKIMQNGGLAFFIIMFTMYDEFYLVMYDKLMKHAGETYTYELIKKIGKNIPLSFPGIVDFLPEINYINYKL
ncbi:Holliday junction resolvase RecU [Mycoplasma tauri]|uniref:Holliday junction resolvase RecU n=1 Tax=Mycoplasma tauri TaxID=547987 RepID=UPI0019677407|nr:Holliday junction resolvase RecU [Mycoplasma tauri]MBZ4203878.1 Holliday junction resolvase RecU [Mycoplasma tauri]QSB07343.1 Holliday junction resolvase RecU [Mycoplasma tauri]